MSNTRTRSFTLPIQDEETLREFVRYVFEADIPNVRVCPDHCTPWEAFRDAYFAKDSMSVWKSSRGFGGKSFLLALLGLTEAVTLKANVNILGGSGTQSKNVHEHMATFWERERAPTDLLDGEPTKWETKLKWPPDGKRGRGRRNWIRALKASETSVRGPHPQRLREDEIDEMDLKIFDSSMGQTMEGGTGIAPQTVLSSTHQYAFGTMTEVLSRAEQKGWPVYIWCWRESWAKGTGWLTQEEIDRKKREVTQIQWDTEYDLQEPNPANRAIDTDAVARMFRRELGEYEGLVGQFIVHQEPVEGATYVTGADWAKKIDRTCIVTWRTDVSPWLLVAYELCNREPWPVMVGKFRTRLRMYPGKSAHDGTGLGGVIDDYLVDEDDEEEINYGSLPDDEIMAILADMPIPPEAIIMKGERRQIILNQYVNAIERGRFIAPLIKSMEAEHRLASIRNMFGPGHLPDTIAAGAISNTQMEAVVTPSAGVIATPDDEQYYYGHMTEGGIAVPALVGGARWHRETSLLNDPRIRAAYRLR